MKKRVFLLLIILIAVLGSAVYIAAAEEIDGRELAVVLPFQAEGVSEGEARVFTDHIAAQLHASGRFRILERSEQEKILEEYELSLSGCVDESCQLEVAKMLAANLIITGSIGPFGKSFVVNIKLIKVETGETLDTVSENYEDMDELLEESEDLVDLLLGSETRIARTAINGKDAAAGTDVKSGRPKFGYVTVAGGYSEIYREGPVELIDLPELVGDGDYYFTSNTKYGSEVTVISEDITPTQFLQGFRLSLGYEYPFLERFSAGAWVSYIFGQFYSDYYPGTEPTGKYLHYRSSGGEVLLADYPDIISLTAGLSATVRMDGAPVAVKVDIGYNFSEILIAKLGFSYKGIYIKGIVGYPIDGMWTTSYEDGGVFGIEGGIELNL